MKIRMTKSFLYSLFLHITILLLVIALLWVTKSEEVPHSEKRCRILLSQVCQCVHEEAAPRPVQKVKAPTSRKKTVKSEPKKTEQVAAAEESTAAVEPDVPDSVEPETDDAAERAETQEEVIPVVEEAISDAPAAAVPPVQTEAASETAETVSSEDLYIEAHIDEIMALLRNNLYYPRMARKRHMEGRVLVRFELHENGEIRNIEVIEAECDILANAAVTTIERLEGKFPRPEEALTLDVPIIYQLH